MTRAMCERWQQVVDDGTGQGPTLTYSCECGGEGCPDRPADGKGVNGSVLRVGPGRVFSAPVGTEMRDERARLDWWEDPPSATEPLQWVELGEVTGFTYDPADGLTLLEPCAMAPYAAETYGEALRWPAGAEVSMEFTAPYPSPLWQLLLGLTAKSRARKMRARFRHVRHLRGRDVRGRC